MAQKNEGLIAAFSLKNPEFNAGAEISGLNLGVTSPDIKDQISENRKKWLESLGGSLDQLAVTRQIHNNHVAYAEKPGVFPDTDALVTDRPGVWLSIQVADCAPVLLADVQNKIIGAAHAGWRGAVADIVPKTIQKMKEIGADPAYMEAFVGPCISCDKFEVGPEVTEAFPDDLVDRDSYTKPHVDLKGLIGRQLKESGIQGAIEISPLCTMEQDQKLYSHRKQNGKAGRMMAVIALR